MRRAASSKETSSRTKGILALMIRCISFLIRGRSVSVKVVVAEEEEEEEPEEVASSSADVALELEAVAKS